MTQSIKKAGKPEQDIRNSTAEFLIVTSHAGSNSVEARVEMKRFG